MTFPTRIARGACAALAVLALGVAPLAAQVAPPDSAAAAAPAGPPGTDLWVATLSVRGAAVRVGEPENITRRAGYDNQPAFTRDGRAVLYTSIGEDGQAEIHRWDRRARTTSRLTTTPESEYSPTPLPSGRGFSTIRVEADSTQRLWRFDAAGGAPALVLERVKPVGYHAWADERTLALFVLGDPPTLQLADTRSGAARVVADSIGRSLHRIPGRAAAISFVRKQGDGDWWIQRLDVRSGAITKLLRTLVGSEDHAWTPQGVALMARGTVLYAWDPKRDAGWREVARFGAPGLGRITRITVSPSGDRIAFAADEVAPGVTTP